MRENVPSMRYTKYGSTLLLRKSPSWLQLHPKYSETLVNWIYLKAGDIDFRDGDLKQLCNARSPLWNVSERALAKLMYRLGPAVVLLGDWLLWLAMLGKLKMRN